MAEGIGIVGLCILAGSYLFKVFRKTFKDEQHACNSGCGKCNAK